ncbi:hypothetical protein [Hydrogenimonas thermophila]|uniref:Uncharacterized protein n=1 Tax=Hydrogenimonas thermophila TaxID=223786 RepID=A0A1I5V2Q8_9BACT|nr:hypothetical protein [Hydrogenimonas thermophila]SFQ01662.1 hypothetical protein SAMN05216234_1841 [Hydrogenimonas thermophila]
MQNYSILDTNRQPYYICFLVAGNDGTEWIDAGLPTPNWFVKFKHSYLIGWLIDGYFHTKKGQEYLNDIIARIIFTLPIKERLKYRPNNPLQVDKIYKLKEFQNLKSLSTSTITTTKINLQGYISSQHDDDMKFWELKLWIEKQIQRNGGEGNMVSFEMLLQYATNMYDWKDFSTAKAKCRNIWRWYEKRNWKYHMLKTTKSEEEIYMTRRERAISNARAKAEKARKAVINAITGLYADEYKKKSGAWHIGKIVEATGVSRNIVAKYLKEFEEENTK